MRSERDLESWRSLQRRAGYFTESGLYRGGLFKNARYEQHEWHDCTDGNGKYCLSWSTNERSEEKQESGTCICNEGKKHYCASWSCQQIGIKNKAECRRARIVKTCRPQIEVEEATCSCAVESMNQKYCQQWNCTETGPHKATETEIYTCMREGGRGRYCERWTGVIVSKKEVESSICQCRLEENNYCLSWTCKERGLLICDEYGAGWCNFALAVGLAGGLGTIFILFGLVSVRVYETLNERLRLFCFTVTLGLLWTPGVIIWGGEKALIWVVGMWGIAFFITLAVLLISLDPEDAARVMRERAFR